MAMDYYMELVPYTCRICRREFFIHEVDSVMCRAAYCPHCKSEDTEAEYSITVYGERTRPHEVI